MITPTLALAAAALTGPPACLADEEPPSMPSVQTRQLSGTAMDHYRRDVELYWVRRDQQKQQCWQARQDSRRDETGTDTDHYGEWGQG